MSSNFGLELGTGARLYALDEASIDAALRSLIGHLDSFAILSRPGHAADFIQAAADDAGTWILEYQEGSVANHFVATDDRLPTSLIAKVFAAYANGNDAGWRDAVEWQLQELDSESSDWTDVDLDDYIDDADDTELESQDEYDEQSDDAGSPGSALDRVDRAINFLDDPVVAAYFETREHEAYYRAIKHAGPKRDFHARLIPVLERFIELTEAPDARLAVDYVMKESRRRATGSRKLEPLGRVRSQFPKGVELLDLTDPGSWDSLKQAYRTAARRHHPDMGGNHDDMVAGNERSR